jgi:hypothetical protein
LRYRVGNVDQKIQKSDTKNNQESGTKNTKIPKLIQKSDTKNTKKYKK